MCDKKKFGIVILNYKGKKWLPELMSSLSEIPYEKFVLIFADNNSQDGSVEYIRENHPGVHTLEFGANLGYSASNNVAAAYAFSIGCDVVVFQNTDTKVEEDWLPQLNKALISDPSIGVAGPVFWDWDCDIASYFMRMRYRDVVPFMDEEDKPAVNVDWIEGSSLCITKECATEVGIFDPRIFMYWEDADLCRRVRLRGYRVVIVPGSHARHYGGGSGAGHSFNKVKEKNEFIYCLTNPERSLFHNVYHTIHLFLVKQRAAVKKRNVSLMGQYIKLLAASLLNFGVWVEKWDQDRRGVIPPQTIAEFTLRINGEAIEGAD